MRTCFLVLASSLLFACTGEIGEGEPQPAPDPALTETVEGVAPAATRLSQRCNTKDVDTDGLGRTVNGECRDMNPGTSLTR